MPTTYIIGHTKPDTDAVVSAMALAHLYNQQSCFDRPNPTPVITDPLNPETQFLFNKFAAVAPKQIKAADIQAEDTIVLVDHNELSQQLPGIPQEQIAEIIDHHKPSLDLTQPLFMTFKAWGSTCTIIYYLMQQHGVTPDKTLASLMLAAILSDTVGFKSATTTTKDKELGAQLATVAGITDIEAFTLEIFKAKSDISSLTDEQIVKNDYKVCDFAHKTMIDQLETVEQERILTEKKDELLGAMQRVKDELEVELLFVAISDILQVNTKLLILGDAEAAVATEAFGGSVTNNILDIGAKLSRKKEIAPAIQKASATQKELHND